MKSLHFGNVNGVICGMVRIFDSESFIPRHYHDFPAIELLYSLSSCKQPFLVLVSDPRMFGAARISPSWPPSGAHLVLSRVDDDNFTEYRNDAERKQI